jgi:hypothetical protein
MVEIYHLRAKDRSRGRPSWRDCMFNRLQSGADDRSRRTARKNGTRIKTDSHGSTRIGRAFVATAGTAFGQRPCSSPAGKRVKTKITPEYGTGAFSRGTRARTLQRAALVPAVATNALPGRQAGPNPRQSVWIRVRLFFLRHGVSADFICVHLGFQFPFLSGKKLCVSNTEKYIRVYPCVSVVSKSFIARKGLSPWK